MFRHRPVHSLFAPLLAMRHRLSRLAKEKEARELLPCLQEDGEEHQTMEHSIHHSQSEDLEL